MRALWGETEDALLNLKTPHYQITKATGVKRGQYLTSGAASVGERTNLSHITASKASISDIDCLKAVLTKFPQLELVWGQTTYSYYGQFLDDWGSRNEHLTARARGIDPSQYGKCSGVLKLKGCKYEIGITERKDGQGYSLVWDTWSSEGRKLTDYIGQDAGKLMAEYSREFVQQMAAAGGYMLTEQMDGDEISLTLMN